VTDRGAPDGRRRGDGASGPGPRGPEVAAGGDAVLPLDPAAVEELTRVTARGGVALFPAEGVYGLAADPGHPGAVERVARLKGRDPAKPSSVLFWALDDALAAVDGAGERVLEAMARVLPGPVGVLVPNPARRFAVATGPDPTTLGVRVPRLPAPVADAPPVVQTSANRAGDADPATVDAVPRPIRRACDLVLDRGVRPGTPSTIVDLRGLADRGGAWRLVRAGAVPADVVTAALGDLGPRAD
jgi:L-threonylcarbamoyladenylate synthase